jgi:hypothetical protein
MKIVSFTFNIPEALRAELEEIAASEDRSLAGQIVNFLKQKVAEQHPRSNEQNAAAGKTQKHKAA